MGRCKIPTRMQVRARNTEQLRELRKQVSLRRKYRSKDESLLAAIRQFSDQNEQLQQGNQSLTRLKRSILSIHFGRGLPCGRVRVSRYQLSFLTMGILCVSTNSIHVPSGSST